MARTFHILKTLGEGAFGSVHLARIEDGDNYVQTLAVKVLRPEWSRDANLEARLRDEGRLLALLNHEHVVRVHGLTRLDGRLAVLMEPIDGRDLSSFEGTSLPPRVACRLVESVADVLDAAWRTIPTGQTEPLHVVHRDIKPSNIMVTTRGLVKVMDFGVARASFDRREAATREQQFGTARFMAPERWTLGVADAPSDIFSLGVTLIELIGGEPVPRLRLSPVAYATDLEEALKPLNAWPKLRRLAAAMCAFDPELRPTALEVVEATHVLGPTLPGPSLRQWSRALPKPTGGVAPTTERTVVVEDGSGDTFVLGPGTRHSTTIPVVTSSPTHALSDASPSGEALRPAWRGVAWFAVVLAAGYLLFALIRIQGARDELDSQRTRSVDVMPEEDLEENDAEVLKPVESAPAALPPVAPGSQTPEPSAATLAPESGEAPVPPPVPLIRQPLVESQLPAPSEVVSTASPDLSSVELRFGPDLQVFTPLGRARSRVALELPVGALTLEVHSGEDVWECTIRVTNVPGTFEIDAADQVCRATY